LLLHDNAKPHTARATIDALETLKFEVLTIPPYSPNLVPSDFHFSPHLKRDLKGTHFTSDDEVKQAVTSWIKQRTPEFFIDGMRKLVLGWEKCIERQGDYVPNNTLGKPTAYHITGYCTICCKKSKSCAPEDGQKFARNMLS
jgi:histone-lysine N-methyltransferase SETMAR